jgi:hypothetical protein
MLFNFHAMHDKADAQLMEVLTEDPELHACHRFLFQLIHHREGERLGLKRAIMLQVLESCCQLEHQPTLASPQEWLAFDEDMNETLHRQAGEFADEFVDTMVDILGHSDLVCEGVASWPSSYVRLYPEHLSSKLIITESLVGDKWLDAFKEPVFSNPKNAAEAFSDDYTPAQCDVALDRIEGKIEEWIGRTCCLGLLDTNAAAFKSNTKGFQSAGQLLTAKYLYVRMNALPADELVLYMKGPLHAILVHRPWGLAADSRVIISRSWLFLRGFTVAVTTNIVRAMQDRPHLTPTETFGNPIHAMMIAMIVQFCLHMNRYIAVCFYKDVMVGPETNALTQNRLFKQFDQRTLSQRQQRSNDRLPIRVTSRVNNADIHIRAHAILCQVVSSSDIFTGPDGAIGQSGQDLIDLFGEPGIDGVDLGDGGNQRWSQLLRVHCPKGTLLHTDVSSMRRHITHNAGNPSAKGKSNEEKAEYDAFMIDLVKKYGPAEDATPGESGKFFWLSNTEYTDESLPEKSKCRGYTVETGMTRDGVRRRCQPEKKKNGKKFVKHVKGQTAARQSDKYPHLICAKVTTRKKSGRVPDIWNKEKSLSFVLVRLELRPPVADTEAETDTSHSAKD